MSEQEELASVAPEAVYLVRDEPIKTHYLEMALAGVEHVTPESLRKAMDEAAEQALTGTLTISGRDANGNPASETIRLRANGDTVYSQNEYSWLAGSEPVYQPSFTFPTEQSLREFVEQRVSAYLDEKLDERVGKALDELAAEMKNKALQPTSRVE